MHLFLTGATGYVGHRLALAAAQQGYTVHALVRNPEAPTRPLHPAIRLFKGDINDADSVQKAMQGCQHAIHAAALARYWHPQPSTFYRINVGGTQIVLEAAYRNKVERMVFTSTCGVLGPSYRNPVCETDQRLIPFETDYEVSKHCAEQLVAEFATLGLPVVTVNLPRVYGPGPETAANPVTRILRNALQRRYVAVPAATGIGSYAFINDVVQGHFQALRAGNAGSRYILGGPNASFAELFGTLGNIAGVPVRLLPVPRPLLAGWGALAGLAARTGLMSSQLSLTTIRRLFRNHAMSSEKAATELGYTITPLADGIAQTLAYFKTSSYA